MSEVHIDTDLNLIVAETYDDLIKYLQDPPAEYHLRAYENVKVQYEKDPTTQTYVIVTYFVEEEGEAVDLVFSCDQLESFLTSVRDKLSETEYDAAIEVNRFLQHMQTYFKLIDNTLN